MSFFHQQDDDSNLQYDDAAFIYFIASTLILAAVTIAAFIFKDLSELSIPDSKIIASKTFLKGKLANLKSYKRSHLVNKSFIIKIVVLVILIFLISLTYQQSKHSQNKLKGFDPYQILGLKQGATLRDVKKAYRKLALQFHPDKNIGDSSAQAKFILISKSYECFTNEEKKANCFKYGNPDGQSSFRVGIGLPAIFINAQYKWYILPIVMSILLILVPYFIFDWSNRTKIIDQNGISIHSYDPLFKCARLQNGMSRSSGIANISSFKELYQDLHYGPISPQNKERLLAQFQKHPQLKKPIFEQLSQQQLHICWQILKYVGNIQDFTLPSFKQHLQKFMNKMVAAVLPFIIKQYEGVVLFGNPNWTINFRGVRSLEAVYQFHRIYYNRSLYRVNPSVWADHTDLNAQEIAIAEQYPIPNLYNFLREQKFSNFLSRFSQERRKSIEQQLLQIPVYNIEAKFKVDNKDVTAITLEDYPQTFFRITKRSKTNSYCLVNNYPYPKAQKILVVAVLDSSVLFYKEITFADQQNQYIGKAELRGRPEAGHYTVKWLVISDVYSGLDVALEHTLTITEAGPQLKNKKIIFHEDDKHLQKRKKGYFEQLMNLELDPQAGVLSDSDDELQNDKK